MNITIETNIGKPTFRQIEVTELFQEHHVTVREFPESGPRKFTETFQAFPADWRGNRDLFDFLKYWMEKP